MRIAFDLDNTLFRNGYLFPTVKPQNGFLLKLFGLEELRQGTKAIFDFCKGKRIEIWIYTTSYRTPLLIKLNFWLYGIKLDGIVNQDIHNRKVKIKSVKHPPTFNINLLIDDSEYVKNEGQKLGYDVILVDPKNNNWVEKVIEEINVEQSKSSTTCSV